MASIFRIQILIAAMLIAGISALLFWDARMDTREFQSALANRMEKAVSALDNEIAQYVRRIHDLAMLFAEEQGTTIAAIYRDPENLSLRKSLEIKIGAYFPGYLAFTVADIRGKPVFVDRLAGIGKGCQQDLAHYARLLDSGNHVYTPYIHFNPLDGGYGRHFDVMVPWVADQQGIFFVSIRDEFLRASVRRFEQQGYNLLILRNDDEGIVELDGGEAILAENRKRRLLPEEARAVVFRRPVAGTLWSVAALPQQQYVAGSISRIRFVDLLIWLLSTGIVIGLTALWYLEICRRRKLADMNLSLSEAVAAHEATEKELRKLTNYDPLTALPNRKSVDEFLERTLVSAEKFATRPAVLFFDIDRFQNFNDTLGHGYGDVLLKEAAQRLRKLIPVEDLLARWGGDEFVVVMQHIEDPDHALRLAEELLQAMRQPIKLHRHAAVATISIGISIYPEGGRDAENLLKNADLAMYRAKNEGRDQARFFAQEMDDIANERRRLEQEIRLGMERGEFEPYFQPRLDLKTGKVVGCEALMRWRHPRRGVLAPGEFLEILENSGLIDQVGDAVRARICECRIAWGEQELDVGVISVNLGGPEFFRHDIVSHLHDEMLCCGLTSSDFEIEITESHMMENTGDSLAKLHALKNMGFTLAVDDFGTGYSSLAYLRRFPVDVVKIDKSFVDGCVTNPEDQDILRAILNLAHGLSLRVVAEGVESIAQMELLRELKCDEVQGYLIACPMPFAEYSDFLQQKNSG